MSGWWRTRLLERFQPTTQEVIDCGGRAIAAGGELSASVGINDKCGSLDERHWFGRGAVSLDRPEHSIRFQRLVRRLHDLGPRAVDAIEARMDLAKFQATRQAEQSEKAEKAERGNIKQLRPDVARFVDGRALP